MKPPFLVVPAIDLAGGRVVRLTEGERQSAVAYAADPVGQAERFAASGAQRLHVVDLDGAFEGRARQRGAVAAICRAVSIPVQVGGGMRDEGAVEATLAAGARFVILGTLAAREPARFAALCERFPGQVIAGIDARDGEVRVAGWEAGAALDPLSLARRVEESGAAAVIFTDITRDGTGRGVAVEASEALARALRIPLIASGGAGSLQDVRRLAMGPVGGVVLGKALYEGTVRLEDALREAAR